MLATLFALFTATAWAEPPAPAIEAVIDDQIRDFEAGDAQGAFDHASPGIQGKFGDPQTFARMVREGYPMIWRPARREWGDLEKGPRGWVQTVLFVDQAGLLHEADYRMELVDGVWRIDGVVVRRMPGATS